MTKPNLSDWAEALIHGITGDKSYNPKLVKWVEAELRDIADKYYQMGFEDGDKDGWWKEQDKKCQHTSGRKVPNLNAHKCSICGDWYRE